MASEQLQNRSEQPTVSSRFDHYESCDICDGPVNTHEPGYFKSPSEDFRHEVCHETGKSPEGYVWEMTETENCCTNRQYNCGHIVYAPRTEQPEFCPECNPLVREGGEWNVE